MYCTKCENQISDEAVICPKCGCIANKKAYDAAFNTVNGSPTQSQQNVPQGNVQNNSAFQSPNDTPSSVLCILSFFIPFLGIIIYAADKQKTPISCKKYLKWSLLNIGLWVAFYVIYIAFVVFCISNDL